MTLLDYPTAWRIARATTADQHHERCSYRRTIGSMLCDCAAMEAAREALTIRDKAQVTEVARLTEEAQGIANFTRCGCGDWKDQHEAGRGKCSTTGCKCSGFIPTPFTVTTWENLRYLQEACAAQARTEQERDALAAQLAEAQRTVITINRSRKVACKAASRLGAKITRLETQLAEAQQALNAPSQGDRLLLNEYGRRCYDAGLTAGRAADARASSPVSPEADIIAAQEARWEHK